MTSRPRHSRRLLGKMSGLLKKEYPRDRYLWGTLSTGGGARI
ncbi:hypothetical protein AM1_1827 [Acaryochloris marina MBIC11017]|uniref:Uncharacterized protein n=1 Tax=Acaryochloris marina (strain MBIC 11017) TaxID=329726 RepID=B0CDC2_ACAM1|nr:hypothetical protein AM1_1827 [Acaryochloris marina MBIC11017]